MVVLDRTSFEADLAARRAPAGARITQTQTTQGLLVTNIPAIDLLSGDEGLRKKLEAHTSLEEIQKDWKEGHGKFLKKRQKYLLY